MRRLGIVLVAGTGVAALSLLALLWQENYPDLETICVEATAEPEPVTPAGKQAAFGVFFACRYGGDASWASWRAKESLNEWRRAEGAAQPPEHSAADIIERRLYRPDRR